MGKRFQTHFFIMMNEVLLEEVKRLVSPLLAQRDTELIELIIRKERGRLILRFLVDKGEGITLDECARLNREIGELLERADIIADSYILEVSSPGLDRPLKSTRDFQRLLGRRIKIVLHQPIEKQHVCRGRLKAVQAGDVLIQTERSQNLRIRRDNIARAQLEVNF